MAIANLLTLIDDIASVLDDVAVLTKKATAKTAGVLGDDLALNAQQVTGVSVERELPVVWAVAKGSAVNKAILVPLALAISAFAPWLVTPLLTIGGLFLCFEGAEKVLHKLFHSDDGAHADEEPVDEKTKIRGAIRTDFILSAEIIAITLGTVTDQPLQTQVLVLTAIAALMTVGVYGLVAGIVKLDDLGLYLSQRANALARGIGKGILMAAPWLMKALGIAGTLAMFLVGGSIVVHGFSAVHHWLQDMVAKATFLGPLSGWGMTIGEGLVGFAAGTVLALIYMAFQKMRGKPAH
ncbi:MAG: DUF808 domain-containing protein [Lautropia sp.]|nr:DUF808 domain-containing protein [Lautropia sp.]